MAQVLVVDDEEPMRKFIRIVLQQDGYSVAESSNGKNAIEIIRDTSIDLMISDVVMPDMDGIELIRETRKAHPKMKILAISGAGIGGPWLYLNIAECLGADAILMKPFSPDQLIEKVSAVLGN
jgi:DNA-binding response OmpR family regulator